ncbi:large ribosomal subunit protein mL62 isoform X2 [Brevipalpus obovatus]|uniref:large ribosomal subunit protein mL62 isoform X2 n=1 Tax=Brevipalpus obovatus TaxID=246614 RepID=UPI003D9F8AE6
MAMLMSKRLLHSSRSFFQSTISSGILEEVPPFKSKYSLEKVYPQSSLNMCKPTPKTIDKFSGFIPMNKLHVNYVRSGKPGGQNVNKIDSQAIVKFKLSEADWIPTHIRSQLQKLHHNSINKEGEWIIRSQKTRQATLNLADCIDKIRSYIAEVEAKIKPPPDPITLELRRDQYERAAQARLREKRHRSTVNKMRDNAMRSE